MSGREWKPGDVAMAQRADGGDDFLVVRTRGDGDYWSAPKGWPWNVPAESLAGFRPLVVIDPEDREVVEALAKRVGHLWKSHIYVADVMQAALREFANPTPPKPPEPTGVGAVVEDASGRKWTRAGAGELYGNWLSLGSVEYVKYADITAVRVLSEGVSDA